MAEEWHKYQKVAKEERLWQGEILSNLVQVRQLLSTVGSNDVKIDDLTHPFAIILTQDCDLASDHLERSAPNRKIPTQLPNVLFCEAVLASTLRGQVGGSDIWKRTRQNKDERYQCIEAIPAEIDLEGQEIPAIGIDFKKYFTVPTDEVYERVRIGEARRRCRMVTPYAEHLASRFFYFRSRIGLPKDHDVNI